MAHVARFVPYFLIYLVCRACLCVVYFVPLLELQSWNPSALLDDTRFDWLACDLDITTAYYRNQKLLCTYVVAMICFSKKVCLKMASA